MLKNKHLQFKKITLVAAGLISAATVALIGPAQSMAAPPTISELTTPSNTGVWGGITKGPDGNVWYVDNDTNKIVRVTPAGVFTEFTITTPTSDARFITTGADGNLWFTEDTANKIGKITPSGTITEFPVTTSAAGAYDITPGPDGNVWFSEVGAHKIAKITPSGTITEFPLSVQPFGIATGPDGNLWVAAPNDNKVARVTTAGVETDFNVPTSASADGYISAGPDGNVWITERDGNKVAKVTPSGVFTEFTVPTSASQPQGITTGPDGRLWFTEAAGDKIGSVTTGGSFTEIAVPTPSLSPINITTGGDGNIWFYDLAILANKIGKVTLPLAPGISNSSVTAVTGKAKTFNVVNGVSNDPSASTLQITSNPTHGIATANTTDGTITYTSNAGYVGSDNVGYKVCSADDTGQCATAVLGISVTASAPDTGFGVYTSNPLRTLAIFGTAAATLLVAARLSRKYLKN